MWAILQSAEFFFTRNVGSVLSQENRISISTVSLANKKHLEHPHRNTLTFHRKCVRIYIYVCV